MNRFLKSFVLFPFALIALPQGAQIRAGDAKLTTTNDMLRIDACDSSIIDWLAFSIDAHERAIFVMPNADSAILNRVVGNELSSIMGRLESNGQLFLINPQGILIGKEGVVEAASFIGSSLNLSDEQFLAKGALFFEGTETSVVNEGTIRASTGHAFLVGSEIVNRGEIQALNGTGALCEGDQVYIHLVPNEPLWFRIQSKEGRRIENAGTIRAADIELHGLSISHSGSLEATGAVERDGRVYLVAAQDLEVNGTILAPGGEIRVLGENIQVNSPARVDVSGDVDGGTILVGGDFQGNNHEIRNAKSVFIGPGVSLSSDASELGDGGKIVVWSNEATNFNGFLSASSMNGNGGDAEVSSANRLFFGGQVNLTSLHGATGTLLLDPHNIVIEAIGGAFTPPYTFATTPAMDVSISGSNLATAIEGANVILQANTDVTIDDTVTVTMNTNSLTLQAGRTIAFTSNGLVTLNGGIFSATINDNGAVSDRDAGIAQYSMGGGSSINTQGGAVTINHGSNSDGNIGEVLLTGATIDAGVGSVSITGAGRSGSSITDGILISGGSITVAGNGTITLTGTGGAGTDSNIGVSLTGAGPLLVAATRDIVVHGTGSGTGNNNYGVNLSASDPFSKSGTGNIQVTGIGGNGVDANEGIHITNTITNDVANLTLYGTGRGTGSGNAGIFSQGTTYNSIGSGTFSLTGQGSAVVGNFFGSNGITFFSTSLTTTTGNIELNGTGGDGPNTTTLGIAAVTSNINSLGTAKITLIGTGGVGGLGNNAGITLSAGGKGSTSVNTVDGDVLIQGFGRGPGDGNLGVSTSVSQVNFTSTGSGKISFIGTGSSLGTNSNYGVILGTTGTISCTNGDLLIQGTGGGNGSQNIGVSLPPGSPMISSAGTANIQIIGLSGAGTDNNKGIILTRTSMTVASGNIQLQGTSMGTGTQNEGISIGSVLPPTIQTMGTGNITLLGIAGPLSTTGPGIDQFGTIQTVNGSILITGSGNDGGSQGILLNGTITSVGTGSISLTSNKNDIEMAPTALLQTASNFISILALTGASNIILDNTVTCGGNFIAAANNSFTLQGGTLTLQGNGTIIVDEQMPNGLGAGLFTNSGMIITTTLPPNDNLAIYAVSGPNDNGLLPVPPPSQVTLGNLAGIANWDSANRQHILLSIILPGSWEDQMAALALVRIMPLVLEYSAARSFGTNFRFLRNPRFLQVRSRHLLLQALLLQLPMYFSNYG